MAADAKGSHPPDFQQQQQQQLSSSHGSHKSGGPSITSRRTDDGSQRRKTQTQRLLEFEIWNNEKTLKELEYSQRRSQKKCRQRARRHRFRPQRVWRRLYLPAVLGMAGGAFLTLAGTLPSLGQGTALWEAREVLVVVGPVVLGLGFLALLLAAACTFQEDQRLRDRPLGPPPEFSLPSAQFRRVHNSSYAYGRVGASRGDGAARRSLSVDTTDMRLPEDLDPAHNYLQRPSGSGSLHAAGGCGSERDLSNRADLPAAGDSPSSQRGKSRLHDLRATACWVSHVTASSQQLQVGHLLQHDSDSHVIAGSPRPGEQSRSHANDSEATSNEDTSYSQWDLRLLTSLDSSGYHSARNSPTSVVAELPRLQQCRHSHQGCQPHHVDDVSEAGNARTRDPCWQSSLVRSFSNPVGRNHTACLSLTPAPAGDSSPRGCVVPAEHLVTHTRRGTAEPRSTLLPSRLQQHGTADRHSAVRPLALQKGSALAYQAWTTPNVNNTKVSETTLVRQSNLTASVCQPRTESTSFGLLPCCVACDHAFASKDIKFCPGLGENVPIGHSQGWISTNS